MPLTVVGSRGEGSCARGRRHPRWRERASPMRLRQRHVGSPERSLWASRPQGPPTQLRVREDGERDGSSVMGARGGALHEDHAPTRKRADCRLVFHPESVCPPGSGGKAEDGNTSRTSGEECWGGLARPRGLACHCLAAGPSDRASAAGPYRAGETGRPVGSGARLTTLAAPLVERQSCSGATSDGAPRDTHSRG